MQLHNKNTIIAVIYDIAFMIRIRPHSVVTYELKYILDEIVMFLADKFKSKWTLKSLNYNKMIFLR